MTSPSETIAKAMEGVTPGPWDVWEEQTPTKAEAVAEMAYQVENSEPFAEAVYLLNANGKCPATTGCGPTSAANAAYIAACNPVAMREVLDELYALRKAVGKDAREFMQGLVDDASREKERRKALALKLEAMQREMAEKDERIAALEAGIKPFADEAVCYDPDTGDNDDSVWATPAYFKIRDLRRARTLIQGEKK